MLKLRAIIMSLALIIPFAASATDMEAVLEVGRDNSNQSAVSQDKIDSTEKQTDKIVNEWKVVSKQVEGLKVYNQQKRIQIQAQLDLMDKLDDQLTQVVVMQRQIPPLAQRMLEGLEKFVELDVPFHIEERRQRLDLVRSSLSNPKVTASEQVRQILEAYNIEGEYGRKIDAFESSIIIDGQEIVANVLVIGRIGMFYQTKDERTSGIWDNDANDWIELESGFRTAIRDGIRMAKKLAPTDMLMLPVIVKEQI
jgi:archaellum component FlaC